MIGETIDCGRKEKRSDEDYMDFPTCSQQQQQQPILQQQRRKVTFRNSVTFREIPHLNNFDEQDITSIWYGPQDYQLFKAVCKLTVKMMMKHGCQITEEDPELCCRGLVRVEPKHRLSRYLPLLSVLCPESKTQHVFFVSLSVPQNTGNKNATWFQTSKRHQVKGSTSSITRTRCPIRTGY
jgi:hypothetical protein